MVYIFCVFIRNFLFDFVVDEKNFADIITYCFLYVDFGVLTHKYFNVSL